MTYRIIPSKDGGIRPASSGIHDAFRKFEHAPIVRNGNADSSIYDLRLTIYALVKMNRVNHKSQIVNSPAVLLTCRERIAPSSYATLKILVAITGASGAIYAQRLLDNLNPREHEIPSCRAITRSRSSPRNCRPD